MTGMRSTVRSYTLLLWRHVLDSLICERYFENAPTVGLIDISLSLTTMSIWVWRWPMSLSASSDSPLISAASPTTTAIRSSP